MCTSKDWNFILQTIILLNWSKLNIYARSIDAVVCENCFSRLVVSARHSPPFLAAEGFRPLLRFQPSWVISPGRSYLSTNLGQEHTRTVHKLLISSSTKIRSPQFLRSEVISVQLQIFNFLLGNKLEFHFSLFIMSHHVKKACLFSGTLSLVLKSKNQHLKKVATCLSSKFCCTWRAYYFVESFPLLVLSSFF